MTAYDPQHDPDRHRYNPNYQRQMAPQHMKHPQQYTQMGAHQKYPNYPYPPLYDE